MSNAMAGAGEPTLDQSIDLASHLSVVDDKHPKRKGTRNDAEKGKDGQLKLRTRLKTMG